MCERIWTAYLKLKIKHYKHRKKQNEKKQQYGCEQYKNFPKHEKQRIIEYRKQNVFKCGKIVMFRCKNCLMSSCCKEKLFYFKRIYKDYLFWGE